MEEMIPVNILIADRTYRIKTLPKDEEVIRKTVKIINDKIIEFKTQFAGKDMQDYIAMVIIWYATQAVADNNTTVEQKEMLNGLRKLEDQLNSVI
ncbi:cell division protein ZapA [Ferruginibacter sp. HRS2-29]|uniref:cell division protein ZapA n=1 Tax=Ferruginibacter sp. HRS2-29 TaxID=2487334 RepID=UPI0020CCD9FF|nr:cell division protein ZapA [Ferruginibacter sp. HRS2-29]MCP9752133.1 cell division protein ZapA [Ferruginibacter sp. HRS2-29]